MPTVIPGKRSTTTLSNRSLDQIVGFDGGRPVAIKEFVERVTALAEKLPDCELFFNVCTDRFRFLLGFCAAIVSAKTNVLPSNSRTATLDAVRGRLGKRIGVMHDGECPSDRQGDAIDLRTAVERSTFERVPDVELDHLCALSFTSGSTGDPKPVPKSWQTIVESTARNALAYLGERSVCGNIVATVPCAHMYGLETTIFLPLRIDVLVHPARPLFAADLRRYLQELAAPRVIVTTPLHARALITGNPVFPPVDTVIVATSPLDTELARSIERCFGAEVREIYGSTETGTLAFRNTSAESFWRLISGFEQRVTDDGRTFIRADFLPGEVELPDLLHWRNPHSFELKGRRSDIIKMAGKRGSLLELNRILLSIPGVRDGIIFQPSEAGEDQRLAALVVAPELDRKRILTDLRARVDDVFLPRPLIAVESLPRESSGKLSRKVLLGFFQSLKSR